MRAASDDTSTFDGTEWVFRAVLNPHGLPTKVTFEYESAAAQSSREVSVADAIDTAGEVEAKVSAEDAGGRICGRFIASNDAGSVTFDVGCHSSRLLPIIPGQAATDSDST